MNTWREVRAAGRTCTLVGAVLALGCGGAAGGSVESTSRVYSEFPRASDIEDMMRATPLPSRSGFGDGVRSTARYWSLEGLLPSSSGATEIAARSPWQVAAKQVLPRTTLTDELTCAAEQLALYHGEHGEMASGALRDFILVRCGASPEFITPALSWVASWEVS